MKLNGSTPAVLEKPVEKPILVREHIRDAKVRIGIVGLGNIGRQHLQAAKSCSSLEVVAVADPQLEADASLGAEVTTYHSYAKMLAHPQLDAVSICVPHDLHAPMTMAALEAGKHVLVEKPLALDCAQGRVLLDAARARNLVLMVEMTHRFYPPLKEARALIESGRIGRIYAVEDRIVEPVSEQLVPWMQSKAKAGGGVALTNGVHMLDRIAAITGQSLSFQSGQIGFAAALGDVEDTSAMSLSLESDVPVQLLAAWPRGVACGGNACDDELTLYGTEATLRVWAWRGWRLEPLDGKTPAQEKLCYAPETDIGSRIQIGVRGALEEFSSSVREMRAPQPSAQDALNAQQLVEEFYDFTSTA